MRYDLYQSTGGKFNFVFDMPPCRNVIKFFRGIKRDRKIYKYELTSTLLSITKNGENI